MRFHGASRTSEFVPDFFVRHPTERPTRTLALSLGQGIKQSPKSATFCFWRIVVHMLPVRLTRLFLRGFWGSLLGTLCADQSQGILGVKRVAANRLLPGRAERDV